MAAGPSLTSRGGSSRPEGFPTDQVHSVALAALGKQALDDSAHQGLQRRVWAAGSEDSGATGLKEAHICTAGKMLTELK